MRKTKTSVRTTDVMELRTEGRARHGTEEEQLREDRERPRWRVRRSKGNEREKVSYRTFE
jgi:hypothetical protein